MPGKVAQKEETIIKFCPVCKTEKEFVRVVEAHIKSEPFTIHTLIGGPPRPIWVEETSLPLAYCLHCESVIYIGPSPNEVRQNFVKKPKYKD